MAGGERRRRCSELTVTTETRGAHSGGRTGVWSAADCEMRMRRARLWDLVRENNRRVEVLSKADSINRTTRFTRVGQFHTNWMTRFAALARRPADTCGSHAHRDPGFCSFSHLLKLPLPRGGLNPPRARRAPTPADPARARRAPTPRITSECPRSS